MNNELWFNKPPGGGGVIERSLRFNSADSAYLSRTPGSNGNRKTWTWAGWVKVSQNTRNWLFTCGEIITSAIELFTNGDLYIYHGDTGSYIGTTARYRDPSAWYHFVVSYDTTQTTAADRIRLYVNGEQAVLDVGTQPTQDYLATDGINSTNLHHIGRQWSSGTAYLGCYLADIHFIDGQALDPTSFGLFDSNGIWQPKAYTGSYGTNGFHLPFNDNSTAAALGTDTSGNNNDWTVNNISVAAGVGNDSLVDTPTNYGTDTGAGGESGGNYCTINPLQSSLTTAATITEGNLRIVGSGSWNCYGTTLAYPTTGKWYYEVMLETVTNNVYSVVGFGDYRYPDLWSYISSYQVTIDDALILREKSTSTVADYGTATNGTRIGFALDRDANTYEIFVNGVGKGVRAIPFAAGTPLMPCLSSYDSSGILLCNFGQRAFDYPAPSGYKCLCTANLPDPLIADGSTAMDVVTYTGNGGTQTISGLGFSPDLVWIKNRASAVVGHRLYDTIRGVTKELYSHSTNAEYTEVNGLTAFNADGFTVASSAGVNENTSGIVAWTWDAGSSTVTNNDGSITSQVRANPSAGFSIVTYTGNSTVGATVGHGLGVAPQLIIIKARNNVSGGYWQVYHQAIGNTKYLELNSTIAAGTSSNRWNNTTPSSTVFTLGSDSDLNGSLNYVAYCFAPVESYSAFGSYTGNGSADGPFVFCNFRPRFLLYKRSDVANDWYIMDTARDTYNSSGTRLYPNLSNAEFVYTASDLIDVTANGFKVRSSNDAINHSSGTYVWAAFAENPFKTARAR